MKNPANGGNPLIENIKKAKAKANSILSFFKLEKKSIEYHALDELYNNILNEFNLSKDMNAIQAKQIDTLKQEIINYIKDKTELKDQLDEKNIYIGQLHKQLALENKKQIKLNIKENQIKNLEISLDQPKDKNEDIETNNETEPTNIMKPIMKPVPKIKRGL